MEKIVIVECVSSGVNYVTDIRTRGYEPIILEPLNEDDFILNKLRHDDYPNIKGKMPKIVKAKESYEETLEIVKEIDPVLIVAGSEYGVELAVRLADDLGLKGNPKSMLPKMTKKFEMHEALKKAGIRYIKGEIFSSEEQALRFYNDLDKHSVVIKPNQSAASYNVFVCENENQIHRACEAIFNDVDVYGNKITTALIQECIIGDEYFVDTVSRNGKSFVTMIWKYNKVALPGGAKIYDSMHTINEYEIYGSTKSLIDYALDVVKAIGIQNGPVHSEFMIDEKGPVLIEINCRVAGADIPAHYLDEIFGHHETNLALDAYLDEDKFNEWYNKDYATLSKGYVKFIMVPYTCEICDAPILDIVKQWDSYSDSFGLEKNVTKKLDKTIDLYTNAGKIYMRNNDPSKLYRQANKLHELQSEHFDMMFTITKKLDD